MSFRVSWNHAFCFPSSSSKCRMRSSMVTTFRPYLRANARHPSRRIIPKLPLRSPAPRTSSPSSTSSPITPTSSFPANRQRSMVASVCPGLCRTPPSFARKGMTCPGRRKSSGRALGAAREMQVALRSCAEIPVEMWSAAESMETVYAVRLGSSLWTTISGSASASARASVKGAHSRPLECRMRKAALAGVRSSAAMIRSPSFSRSVASSTTRNSPRAGQEYDQHLDGMQDSTKSTESCNGVRNGVEPQFAIGMCSHVCTFVSPEPHQWPTAAAFGQ